MKKSISHINLRYIRFIFNICIRSYFHYHDANNDQETRQVIRFQASHKLETGEWGLDHSMIRLLKSRYLIYLLVDENHSRESFCVLMENEKDWP